MTPEAVLAFSVAPIAKGVLMALFVLTGLVLAVVVLLQEGKGGGIAGAFGGAASDTFGVKAGSVNRFTAIVAGIFIVLALAHAGISAATESVIAPALSPEPAVTSPGETPPMGEPPPAMNPEPPVPAGMGEPPAMGETPPPPAMGETPPPPPPGGVPPPPPPPPPEPAMEPAMNPVPAGMGA